jgi:HK97 family phage major capsid protein
MAAKDKRRVFSSFQHSGRGAAVLERKDKTAGGGAGDDEVTDATHLLGEVKTLLADHKTKSETLDKEVKEAGKATKETAEALAEVRDKMGKMTAQLLELAQRQSVAPGSGPTKAKTLGEMFTECDSFKSLQKLGKGNASMKISRDDLESKTTITTGTLPQPTSGVIMPQRVPGIFGPQLRQLRVRDLLPQGNTTSNAIDYVKELAFTNAAAPVAEAAAKPESALTFQVAVAPVRTIAHWIPATNQVLDDFVQLRGYIDNRLTYGLKLVEEAQLLSGDGTGQNILGIIPQATAYDNNKTQAGDTKIDILRHAIGQARVAEFPVDGIVVNPVDWEAIELTKANTGEYIIGDPKGILPFTIWGRAVVETTAITAGQFLTGAFQMGAQIWDRQDVTIDVSTEHQDFFIKNMVAIRVEERLALTVYRPGAFIYGAY